ncbi:MAG: RIP metalloprotease RseP [Bacteroidales bacterium]|jgi:regulator of sigma E protease|nr:RIP metalloprotease RseP [Bacteroidales bacterium]
MGISTQVIGLIAGLGILVFVHELGHYMFARFFGTRVEKFYLFFNPGLSLVRMKKIEGRLRFSFLSSKAPEEWAEHPDATEFGIGWLPFGGYCSIAGMVDETKSEKDLDSEQQPWEFRSKPTWQRFFIISGGVIMNFITAIVLYIAILFSWGKEYIPLENAKYGLVFSNAAQYAGFQNGDKIISVDGGLPETIRDFQKKLLLDNPKEVIVERDNRFDTLFLKEDNWKKLLVREEFCSLNFPFVIDEISAGFPAEQAGLQQGDSLVGLDSMHIYLFSDFQEELRYAKNKEVTLHFYRGDTLMAVSLVVNEDGKIGASVNPYKYLQSVTESYTFFESIPMGVKEGINQLSFYVKQFKRVFTKEGASQLGGFITIGSIFPKTWNWEHFWAMTAFLSVILAFMNILPIPALDGGYILFILIEMITRRKPSDKFIGYANTVGFILLIMLLVYANGMDVLRLFR